MKYHIIPDEDALHCCTWCGGKIGEFDEVFAADAGVQPEADLREYQGHCIEIELVSRQKTLNAMVTAEDSEAKADGKDLMFLVCSADCLQALQAALKKEAVSGSLLAVP